jgi:hypothetical protein
VSGPAAAARPAEALSVDASLFSARRQADVTAAAASLPQLFRPATGGQASECLPDIRVIDGAAPSWPGTLAQVLDTPVRGVLLSAPTIVPAAEVEALAARAESASCCVVVAMPFAYDVTVGHGLSRLQEQPETLSIIDSIATVSDSDGAQPPRSLLAQALLAQLSAIRMIAGTVPALTMNQATDHAYSVTGTSNGMTVMLAGLVSSVLRTALRVDLVGVHHRHTIRLAGPSSAPATFLSYDASGMSAPMPSYESGLRNAWRNLHAAVTSSTPVRFGLRELAADLASAPDWQVRLQRQGG